MSINALKYILTDLMFSFILGSNNLLSIVYSRSDYLILAMLRQDMPQVKDHAECFVASLRIEHVLLLTQNVVL